MKDCAMEIMEDTNSNSQVRISGSFDSPHDSLMFFVRIYVRNAT